jgi:hypothetical protein
MKLNHLATLVFGLNTFECHWHGFQVLCSKAWKMVGQTGWSVSIARDRCYDFKKYFSLKYFAFFPQIVCLCRKQKLDHNIRFLKNA